MGKEERKEKEKVGGVEFMLTRFPEQVISSRWHVLVV
jgi:hypothetical protein